MLHAVALLGGLGIVPAVHGAHQIAGDAADALKTDAAIVLVAAAAGALVVDDAGVAADGIAVNGVVDAAVADACIVHAADDALKGVKVLHRVAVQLHIGDVTGVGQRVIGRLQLDLFNRTDVVINRDMEGICVVFPVGRGLSVKLRCGTRHHQ